MSKIKKYQIFSAIFVFILGTLLHFTYNLSGNNNIVAFFSSINESVWEHLKLLYFPMLLTIIIGEIYLDKNVPNFICSKIFGMIASMFFMVIFFYTYSGVFGKNIAIVDIASFFVSVIIGEYISYKLILSKFKCNNNISKIILILMLISFALFTFITPDLGIFKDPVTGQYGLSN